MEHKRFEIEGMTCAACEAAVKRSVKKVEGVDEVVVNLLAGTMDADYDPSKTDPAAIIKAVTDAGYGAVLKGKEKASEGDELRFRDHFAEEAQELKFRLQVSVPFLLVLMYVSMGSMFGAPLPYFMQGAEGSAAFALTQLLLTLPVLIVNRSYFTRGFGSLIRRNPNMDALIAVGSAASMVYGIFALYRIVYGLGFGKPEVVHSYLHDLYFESAATILTLITLGKYLETRAKSRTSDAIKRLMDLTPPTANVLRDGVEIETPAEDLKIGDLIVIRPGESVPVDGIIVEGESSLDESALTGESIPLAKAAGDPVISATINKSGTFIFRATKVGNDTTLAKIIALVEDANATKAPIQSLADKIAAVFVPAVMLIAALTFVIWLAAGQSLEFALRLGISVLVISCPCALGLATPVAIMVGTGKGAENSVLIKSAEALEILHEADTVVFDKTGTITEGKPYVTDLAAVPRIGNETLLKLAASLEQKSEQPLASAVTDLARERKTELLEVKAFKAESGMGVRGETEYEGRNCLLLGGNRKLMERYGVDIAFAEGQAERLAGQGKTPMYFALDGKLIGIIAAADIVKNNSREALEKMRSEGLQTVMLTGDNKRTAKAMAERLAIDEFYADVLPQDKDRIISDFKAEGRTVVMVGDGINDAPALTRADVGIAIGAGTDVAIESADVVLQRSDLMDVLTAYHLSRRTIRTIKQNLFWAFFYNVINIPVAAGLLYPFFKISLNPMIAAFAMSISSVFVVLNALRLNRFKADRAKEYVSAAAGTQEVSEGLLPEAEEALKHDEFEEKANKETLKEVSKMRKKMPVKGMMCMHCQRHVTEALNALPGVSAEVNLEEGFALMDIEGDVKDETLQNAVKEAGYEAGTPEVLTS